MRLIYNRKRYIFLCESIIALTYGIIFVTCIDDDLRQMQRELSSLLTEDMKDKFIETATMVMETRDSVDWEKARYDYELDRLGRIENRRLEIKTEKLKKIMRIKFDSNNIDNQQKTQKNLQSSDIINNRYKNNYKVPYSNPILKNNERYQYTASDNDENNKLINDNKGVYINIKDADKNMNQPRPPPNNDLTNERNIDKNKKKKIERFLYGL